MMTPLLQCSEHKTNDGLPKIWRQLAQLLEEAVQTDNYAGVEMLLQHESMLEARMTERHPSKYKQKHTLPIILATEKQNFQMVRLFLRYHYVIPQPHITNCKCDDCFHDKLGQARHRLSILRALSNPMWIALTSEDPFLTLFKLYHLNRDFLKHDDSFEHVYEHLSNENVDLCIKLLDEIRSEREGALLMKYKTVLHDHDRGSDLSFIDLAVEYSQKEVVAHPVVQHFLTSRIFDEIPGWRTSGMLYKMVFVFFTGISYPVTSILNILLPCWNSVGGIAMKPFFKFVNGAASFITFLILLSIMCTENRNGLREGETPTTLELVVFIWLLGFCYGELQQVYKRGLMNYLSSGWNWVDIGMDTLMMFSYITWFLLMSETIYEDAHMYDTIVYLADGTFSVAVILSFLRIIYLCQITSYLGLLQLCLGEMIMVILQFAFIATIVLLSFTTAMVFLFRASAKHKEVTSGYQTKNNNQSGIYSALTENFNGFWATLFTMGWVSLSMKDTETVEDFADGTLIHLWANLLFIVYFAGTMIVVLNMLIAMMNNSYQVIADNLGTEHKYSRTCLWMEYISDEQTRPVPLNLIPTINGLKRFYHSICNFFCHCNCSDEIICPNPTLEKEAKRKYKQLCDVLIDRYMLKEHGISIRDDKPVEEIESEQSDEFLQKIRTMFDVWKVYEETGEYRDDNPAEYRDNLDNDLPSPTPQSQQLYISDEAEDTSPEWKDFLVL